MIMTPCFNAGGKEFSPHMIECVIKWFQEMYKNLLPADCVAISFIRQDPEYLVFLMSRNFYGFILNVNKQTGVLSWKLITLPREKEE